MPKIIQSVDLILGETNLNYIGKSETLNIAGTGSEVPSTQLERNRNRF